MHHLVIKAFVGILNHYRNLFWFKAKRIQACSAPPPHFFSLKLSQASWVNGVITCSHNESIVKYSWHSLELWPYSKLKHTHFHTGLSIAVLSGDWQWPQVQLPHACEVLSHKAFLIGRDSSFRLPDLIYTSSQNICCSASLHRVQRYALFKVVEVSVGVS